MRKTILLLASVALAMLVAGGVAWAATIQCPNAGTNQFGHPLCYGTKTADTMRGTNLHDEMYGRAGADTIYGRSSADSMRGGPGSDKMYGGGGKDRLFGQEGVDRVYGQEGSDSIFLQGFDDRSNDYLYGGRDNDGIVANGKYGVDRIYGDRGADSIVVYGNAATGAREIVDCGPGTDSVSFDEGVDVVKNCEIKEPLIP